MTNPRAAQGYVNPDLYYSDGSKWLPIPHPAGPGGATGPEGPGGFRGSPVAEAYGSGASDSPIPLELDSAFLDNPGITITPSGSFTVDEAGPIYCMLAAITGTGGEQWMGLRDGSGTWIHRAWFPPGENYRTSAFLHWADPSEELTMIVHSSGTIPRAGVKVAMIK